LICLNSEDYYKRLSDMREMAPDTSSFPTARCGNCERTVLTYVDYDKVAQRRCVHCDSLIGTQLEWITAAELEAEGYAIGIPNHRGGCGAGGCGTCSVRGH
jgi:hypothetical protein